MDNDVYGHVDKQTQRPVPIPEQARIALMLGVNYFDRSATIILAGLSEA